VDDAGWAAPIGEVGGIGKFEDVAESKKVSYLTVMSTHFSKVTSKSQTVLPRAIRDKLMVKPGDMLRYRETDKGVLIDKVQQASEDDPFAVFHEWSSAADDEAYGKL
jgi:antitoxin PrlF